MIIKDLTPYANDGKYTNTYWNNGRINTVTWVTGTTTNTATYDINALGQRVRKATPSSVVGTRRFMYDEAGRLAGEYDSAGKLVQETVWLGDVPVATLRPKSGSTTTPIAIDIFYVHADHLGTPRAITRPTDNKVVWSWENTEAFGNNLPNENPSALGTFSYNLRMPGQYFDQETGTFYNYFRDYDPSLGRYVQSDPIGLVGSVNTFAYVDEKPTKYIDASGLQIVIPLPPPPTPMPTPLPGFGDGDGEGFERPFWPGWIRRLIEECTKEKECEPCKPPAGQKFNKVTHYTSHSQDPNKGTHGCMQKTGSPVHWHYDVMNQNSKCDCFHQKHLFGGCGVAPG